MSVTIRLLEERDVARIASAFREIGWSTKPAALYQRYLSEQGDGHRTVLVAVEGNVFVGYVTILWQSGYPPFQEGAIPELVDFNVLPRFRRRGTGGLFMDEAERRIAERSPLAGIGVGMDPDYGAAQRLYVNRGYVPDGRGLWQGSQYVTYGDNVTVDDDLALMFTKRLNHHRELGKS